MKRGLRYDFSLLALLLIPVGVSLNVVGYQLSTILKLPVIIDQIGTMLVSMIAGPWVGMLTGLLGNVVSGMINPIAIAYGFVSMSIGFVSGFFSRWKMYNNIIGILVAIFLLTIVSAFTAAIVTVFLFGGVTGAGTDLVTAAFLATGRELWNSVISTNLISGTINTVINLVVGVLIVRRIPDRFLVKLNYGEQYIKKGALAK
ncbi:histidine kinase [Tetragenococcus solitarius]|uniref:ECF transporter S component n=1 Tax=Tetragenococcus solitarius TaxID=71453 RepID=A0ABN3Y3R8_9ENTE|nr:histidine kinase [Tetragenococcus solitarius]